MSPLETTQLPLMAGLVPGLTKGSGERRSSTSRLVRKAPSKEADMARCEQCGNDYDKSFEVSMGGRTMIFDSFECAIQALAPSCPHCCCRIIGHGVEHDGTIFCCVHCAK